MKRNVVWSIASILMVAVLLLASCGPKAAAPAPVVPAPAAPASTTATPTPAAPAPLPSTTAPPVSSEKPKYGGTLTFLRPSQAGTFDNLVPGASMDEAGMAMFEQMIFPDWSKGEAGTGEFKGNEITTNFEGYGCFLCESWEIPEIGTFIFHVRKGMHFALNPASEASRLVNGREFTADDVVYSILRQSKTPGVGTALSQASMAKALTVEKTGPWEVTVKTPVGPLNAFLYIFYGGKVMWYYAQEVIQKYGNAKEWYQTVGTGPFMLTDYVYGSSATLIKNPNYWGKNPVGPGKGDQAPYVDTLKFLVVPDNSTRMAALRTGKADWTDVVEWEDAQSLFKTNSKLQYKGFDSRPWVVSMRLDKDDLPFKDVKVRQALMMATDFEGFKKDFYGGYAEILNYPVPRTASKVFIPLEKLPAELQSLYKYNPEKARQLLAEAGYPKGFKTKIVVLNRSERMEPIQALKAMWAKVGVDMEIQPREQAVFSGIRNGTQDELKHAQWLNDAFGWIYSFNGAIRGEGGSPAHTINFPPGKDPVIEKAYQEIQKHVMLDQPKADELYRPLVPYLVQQAYVISLPSPNTYDIWQPWVKNLYPAGDPMTFRFFIRYAWIDQDLKEQLTGRR